MAITLLNNPRAYVAQVMSQSSIIERGRWVGVAPETPVPGGAPGDVVKVSAAKALSTMCDGEAALRYVSAASPAYVGTFTFGAAPEQLVYRVRDHAVISTGLLNQSPYASVLMAAILLVNDLDPTFTAAYLALIDGIAAGLPQPDLDGRLISASAALLVALDSEFRLTDLTWWIDADPAKGEIDEAADPGALPLDELFTSPENLRAYLAGKPGQWALLATQSASASINAAPLNVGPRDFIGPQLDQAVAFMQEVNDEGRSKHVLHHGPTGTAKSLVWELAMTKLDPAFDITAYPYFVHGSAGLEDIDFVGQIMPQLDGSKAWTNGPLVRAMLDGARLKVEEINRLPGSMLNILLGAMDYGRIAVTRHQGEIINAAPGFAVDGLANIGQEYTATEELDPAIMRRFQRKIEYDFLEPAAEVRLLRSRNPNLDPEDAEALVRIANAIRSAYADGASDLDVDLYVSPAALIETAGMVAAGVGFKEAVAATWLADVAHTKAKRLKVQGVVEQNLRDKKLPGTGKRKGKP